MDTRIKMLKKQWSSKNEKPFSSYTKGSHYKAWWICEKGHEWQAIIKSRYHGCDCPYCSSRNAWPGETDLATVYPEISKEWHPDKNGDLQPSDVLPNSNKVVWWICKNGHEWKTSVAKRTAGKGCPYCNHKLASENNNFAVMFPEKLELWDWDRNLISPYAILPHSNRIVWWVCKNGHHWSSAVNYMARRASTGCPYCAGKKAIPGETDLATTDPAIAAEWDPEKNKLGPEEVTRCSHKKIFWICPRGHSYKAQIANRVNGRGCPICAGKQKGDNIW